MIPRKVPVWLLDLWRYESSHDVHASLMDEQFTRFLYNVKGFRKRQEIKK